MTSILKLTFILSALVSAIAAGASANDMGMAALKRHLPAECFDPSTGIPQTMVVNGHKLSENQSKNIDWIRRCVVPMLPGERADAAMLAARAAWWALREGVLTLSSDHVFRYSNCHERFKGHLQDHPTSEYPLHVCGTNIWQVGIAAGQVANYSDKQISEAIDAAFRAVDPSISDETVLAWTASLAGYGDDPATFNAIIDSKEDTPAKSDKIRRSWMLRNPVIGFMLTEKLEVEAECMKDKKKYCFENYHNTYPEAIDYAKNAAAMKNSMADLKSILLAKMPAARQSAPITAPAPVAPPKPHLPGFRPVPGQFKSAYVPVPTAAPIPQRDLNPEKVIDQSLVATTEPVYATVDIQSSAPKVTAVQSETVKPVFKKKTVQATLLTTVNNDDDTAGGGDAPAKVETIISNDDNSHFGSAYSPDQKFGTD